MATTKNLADLIRRRLASDPGLADAVEAERFSANVGAEIFEARTRAGLSQKALADLVGMHQSAIARLEDADYDGHSLKTLQRIATALGKRIQVAFVDQYQGAQSSDSEEIIITFPAWKVRKEWKPTVTTNETTI